MRASPRHVSRLLAVLAAFAAALVVTGCGNPVGSVSGKVTYKGTALKGGNVVFAKANGQNEWAEIQEDGSYKFDKIPAGPVKVAVVTSSLKPPRQLPGQGQARANNPPPGQENPNKSESAADRAKRYVAIPDKYEDPKTSGKEYTVKSGNQTYDITLE